MSSSVIDEIRAVIPSGAKMSGTGFLNFNCPACGDRRERGGISFTPSGGFRYRCFNGGCTFEKGTGWEEGKGFGGRARKFFELLGGDVRRIPNEELLKWHRYTYNSKGEVVERGKDLEVVYKFPTMDLPEGSMLLMDAARKSKVASDVLKTVAKKDPANVDKFPYMWAPGKYSYYYLIPFLHYHDQIVGYVGRHIYLKSGQRRFIGSSPSDYMFNQHLISTHRALYLFVVESPMDAVALQCVAARGSRLTDKQVNLLKVSGKEIVLVPDLIGGEWKWFYDTAVENNWLISCPNFGSGQTDVMKSVSKNGLLFTSYRVMQGIAQSHEQAKQKMLISSPYE